MEELTLCWLSRIWVPTYHTLSEALLDRLGLVETRSDKTNWVVVGRLVLGHHQFELPGLGGLQAGKHGRIGPVLLESGLKLGSVHLAVLELAEHIVVLHT